MNAIQMQQNRRMEVERTIGRASGLSVIDAWRWAGNAREAMVKAQAWMAVATEIDADIHILPALVDRLAIMISEAETAYYNAVVSEVRESFVNA